MDTRVETFFNNMKGKKIAFCGIGRSNLPLTKLFAKYGAIVTACDRKTKDNFADIAQELESSGITMKCGEDYLDNLDVDIIFRAPGMYYNMPRLTEYRGRGVAVTSEMEVFFDICPCKIYGVTGSDGKTTTTSVIAKLLEKAGKNVYIGGNIGKPLLPDIEKMTTDDYAVVELSSFQLISMKRSPDVAVVTNVAPNHLDVHKTMDEYINAKLNLINHQNAFSRTVLNFDNNITRNMSEYVRGEKCFFSRQAQMSTGAFCDKSNDIYLVKNGEKHFVMNADEIFIKGDHNIENYLAAISAVAGEVSVEDIISVAKTFSGVEHRIEFVRELDGIKYYNDSIATSPTRTIAGLKAFNKKIIIIAGGYDKHIPYEPLGPYVNKYVKVLILMGATANKIEKAVTGDPSYKESNIKIVHVDNMNEAVDTARQNATNGDIISLSPASAGFDKYKDFEERGRHFKKIVKELQ